MAKSSVKCTLFVQVVDKSDLTPVAAKARQYNLDVLQFVEKHVIPRKSQLGIDLHVKSITREQLQNPKVNAALKKQKVVQLPALITPSNVYLGATDIKKLFSTNIQRYEAAHGAAKKRVDDEDGLEKYMRSEMTTRRMDREDDERAIGETSGDMMSAAQDMMKKREQRMAKSRPSAIPDIEEKTPQRHGPSRGPPRGHSRPASHEKEDDEIGEDRTVSSIIGSLSSMDRGHGGDDDDYEGPGPSAADNQIVKAYWENQELTPM